MTIHLVARCIYLEGDYNWMHERFSIFPLLGKNHLKLYRHIDDARRRYLWLDRNKFLDSWP